MPGDVPVATMAVGMGGPRNAGLLAVQILATGDESLRTSLAEFKQSLSKKIAAKDRDFQTATASNDSKRENG